MNCFSWPFSLSLSLSFFHLQLHYINRSVYLFIYQSNYILYFFLFHYIDRKYQKIFIFPLRQYIYFPIIYLFQSVTTTSVKMKKYYLCFVFTSIQYDSSSFLDSQLQKFLYFLSCRSVCMYGGGGSSPTHRSVQTKSDCWANKLDGQT